MSKFIFFCAVAGAKAHNRNFCDSMKYFTYSGITYSFAVNPTTLSGKQASIPRNAVSAIFACVVMYDAAGLRRCAGQMATQLNMLVDSLYEQRPHNFRDKLIELLGHTPLEVSMGALLGIAVSYMVHYQFLFG